MIYVAQISDDDDVIGELMKILEDDIMMSVSGLISSSVGTDFSQTGSD